MPLSMKLLGTETGPITHEVDSRWLMAYAASLGRTDACHLDTRRDDGIVAHPLFPVCLEWPAVLALGERLAAAGLTRGEAARSVHYTHDLTIHRAPTTGDRLHTTATLRSIDAHRSGTLTVVGLETIDDAGDRVATTLMGSLYRDTGIEGGGPDRSPAPGPASTIAADGEARPIARVPIPANAAHVYTECARIWNPIHTDPRTAERAGLPGIILHGTATLAMAVSAVVDHEAGGRPERVRRVAARFVGMVPMPGEIEVRVHARPATPDPIRFEVVGADGRPVIRDGVVQITGS